MKKILSTILFTMSFIATAHAETSISLTPTQSQAVEKLTDASVDMLDIGGVLNHKYGKPIKINNSKQTCFIERFATSEGYRQYQHERAIKYVIAKTPQQVQQDLNLLTPKLITTTHELFEMGFKDKMAFSTKKISSATEKRMAEISSDPTASMPLIQLMTDTSYEDLRNFLNIDGKNTRNGMVLYMLWGMQQCDIKINELENKAEK